MVSIRQKKCSNLKSMAYHFHPKSPEHSVLPQKRMKLPFLKANVQVLKNSLMRKSKRNITELECHTHVIPNLFRDLLLNLPASIPNRIYKGSHLCTNILWNSRNIKRIILNKINKAVFYTKHLCSSPVSFSIKEF